MIKDDSLLTSDNSAMAVGPLANAALQSP
jgi:hypothetical protein